MTTPHVVLTPRYAEAVQYASELHAGQTRKSTNIAYISHLLGVSSLVLEAGGDEDMAIAALLHDGPEDQGGQATLVWNEASLKMFWRGSPAEMADLTERAYRIIKERDPSALVVGASTTVRLLGAFERFFPAYVEELAARDWPVDVLAVHSYPSGVEGPLERARHLRVVDQVLTRLDAPVLPVWDTELNYGLAGPGDIPRTEIAGDKALLWTVRTYLDSLRFGVDRTYLYIWTPKPYDLLGMQVTNDSGAAAGLRVVEDWVAGGEWGGCEVSGLVNSCLVRKDGEVAELVWADFAGGEVSGFSAGASVCDALGSCSPVGADGVVAVTTDPLRVAPAREFVEVDNS
jgi:hypothetical protein